jgi:hypothetical protein
VDTRPSRRRFIQAGAAGTASAALLPTLGISSDRQFLGLVGFRLVCASAGPDPVQPSAAPATPYITTVQLTVAELIAEGRVRLHPDQLRQLSRLRIPEPLRRPYWLWLLALEQPVHLGYAAGLGERSEGGPVGYDLLGQKTGQERQAVIDLACGQPDSVLFCDKGLWGRERDSMLELTGVELITPERHRLGEHPPAELEKARIRRVIESVFANLTGQMRLDNHLPTTVGRPGPAERTHWLLAHTPGMFCNLLAGRPARALGL